VTPEVPWGEISTAVGVTAGSVAATLATAGAAAPLTTQGLLATGAGGMATVAASNAVLGSASSGTTISVFWSGWKMEEAATAFAAATGGQTCRMALGDIAVTNAAKASAVFANNASGVVHVFQDASAGVPTAGYWATIEYPILVARGVEIVYHIWTGTEWIVKGQ